MEETFCRFNYSQYLVIIGPNKKPFCKNFKTRSRGLILLKFCIKQRKYFIQWLAKGGRPKCVHSNKWVHLASLSSELAAKNATARLYVKPYSDKCEPRKEGWAHSWPLTQLRRSPYLFIKFRIDRFSIQKYFYSIWKMQFATNIEFFVII